MKTPIEISKKFIDIGKAKASLSAINTLLLGVLAGMFIALAGVASCFASIYATKFAGSLIFAAGLAMVIIAGSELFTGNCLIIVSVLQKKVKAWSMLRNWVLVYIGNLVGGLLVAALVVFSGTVDLVSATVTATAAAKCGIDFWEALMRGVLCNVLVCIAVWMACADDTAAGKVITVILPIAAFVVCGYEHCVANMYFIPAGLFSELRSGIDLVDLSWGGMFINNLIPVTIGNIIGGSGLVGAMYWFIYLKGKKED